MKLTDLKAAALGSRLRLNGRNLALVVLGCAVVFTAIATVLPKRYKTRFVMTIYTKYFQNPLVKDFVSEVQDPSELRAQRESLIRQAFDETFIDKIGEKYSLYRYPVGDPRRGRERDEVYKRIEIIPLSTTSFRVSFLGRSAQEALGVADDLVARLKFFLISERKRMLGNLRDAVKGQMESMGLSVARTADPLGSVGKGALQAELSRLELEIAAKATQFTPQHPVMAEMRARVDRLRRALAGESVGTGEDRGSSRHVSNETIASLDVYRDLLIKMNYLTIAADMENENQITSFAILENPQMPAGPVFPRKSLFALSGALLGLLACLGCSLYQEARVVNAAARTRETAESLGLPMLGKLPTLPAAEKVAQPASVPARNFVPGAPANEWG